MAEEETGEDVAQQQLVARKRNKLAGLLDPNSTAASEHVGEAAPAIPEHTLILECEMSGDERRAQIRKRIADLSDPATALGKSLADFSDEDLKNPATVNTILDALQTLDVPYISTFAKEHADENQLTIANITTYLQFMVQSNSSGMDSIFEPLSVSQKNEEEGERRRRGEQMLVIAKTFLLSLGAQAVGNQEYRTAGNAIASSKEYEISYPEWFIQSVEVHLRSFDVAQTTFADAQMLEEMMNNLYGRFDTFPAEKKQHALEVDDAESLTGIEYIFRKCNDAEKQLKKLQAEEKKRVAEEQHTKAYETNAIATFSSIADEMKDQAIRFFRGSFGWDTQTITVETSRTKYIEDILRADTKHGWWKKEYVPNKSNITAIIRVLQRMSQDDSLTDIVDMVLDSKNSDLRLFDDGSGNRLGQLSEMPEEKRRGVIKDLVERQLFAAIYGLVLGQIERDDNQADSRNADDKRQEAMTSAFTAVGKGHAVELLRAASTNPETRGDFSESQLRFADAFLQYYDGTEADSVYEKRIDAMIRTAATADREMAGELEEKKEKEQTLIAQKEKLANILDDEHQVELRVLQAKALAKKAAEILDASEQRLRGLLTVEGQGTDRRLVMKDKEGAAKLVTAITQSKTELLTNPQDSEKSSKIEAIAGLETQLLLINKLATKLDELDKVRKVIPDTVVWGQVLSKGSASYPKSNLVGGYNVETKNNELLTFQKKTDLKENNDNNIGLIAEFKASVRRARELHTSATVKDLDALQVAIKELNAIIKQSETVLNEAITLAAEAADTGISNIFRENGPMQSLNETRNGFFGNLFT